MGELGLLLPGEVPEDDSHAAYKLVAARIAALALQGARLGELVLQAIGPGNAGPEAHERPTGWREQVLVALADGPLDERCRTAVLKWAATAQSDDPA